MSDTILEISNQNDICTQLNGVVSIAGTSIFSSLWFTPIPYEAHIRLFFHVAQQKQVIVDRFFSKENKIIANIVLENQENHHLTDIRSKYKGSLSSNDTLINMILFLETIVNILPSDDSARVKLCNLSIIFKKLLDEDEALQEACFIRINELFDRNRMTSELTTIHQIRDVVDYISLRFLLDEFSQRRSHQGKFLDFFSEKYTKHETINAINSLKLSLVSTHLVSDDEMLILKQGSLGESLKRYADKYGFDSVETVINKLKLKDQIIDSEQTLSIR